MKYATIKWYDISNGPGVRVSLYVSGCRNHCKNCFNPETWDFNYGEPFTEDIEKKIIEGLKPDYIKGFTLLGGDPFEPENQKVLAPFLETLRKAYPKSRFGRLRATTTRKICSPASLAARITLCVCLTVLMSSSTAGLLRI